MKKLSNAGRLSLAYLAVFMALSISFSFAIYHVSSSEFNRQYRRVEVSALIFPGPGPNIEDLRSQRLNESDTELKNKLILLNVATFIGGGLISYALAKKTLKPIEEALDAQSRFTSDASHELRTPLTAMQTEIEVSLRDKNLSIRDAKDTLKSSLEEVAKLRNLSDGLLKLAQNRDKLDDLKIIEIKTLVQEAVASVAKQAANNKIIIQQKTKSQKLLADYQTLKEALVAVIDNAIKYSSERTVITVSVKVKDDRLTISVTDQGQGIAQSSLPHIFDRFYRVEDSRHKDIVGGYGLGLAITKKIIEAHQGKITVVSNLGKGTTFNLVLPIRTTLS